MVNRKIERLKQAGVPLRDQEHCYEVVETPTGFKIVPIEATRDPLVWDVGKDGFWTMRRETSGGEEMELVIPMFCFYKILGNSVLALYEDWNPNKNKNTYVRARLFTQAVTTTKKTLARPIKDIWLKKNHEICDEETILLHKKMYSTANGSGNWGHFRYLLNKSGYSEEEAMYARKDLMQYRSARCAFLSYTDLIDRTDWKKQFFDISNPHIRKTISNFPNVPYFFVHMFRRNPHYDARNSPIDGEPEFFPVEPSYLDIKEPLTTRIRFLAYYTFNNMSFYNGKSAEDILLRSSDEDLKKAVRYIDEKHFKRKTDFRRTRLVLDSFHAIFDYPYIFGKWDIVGLAKRSEQYHWELERERERYHQEAMAIRSQREIERLKQEERFSNSETALPPISLPSNKNIKFLNSYKEIQEEGSKMGHCIGTYAIRAVKGSCYLFHVDYNRETASVEVGLNGYVVQSYGPHDSKNSAADYGRRVLSQWGKNLNKLENRNPILRYKELGEENNIMPSFENFPEREFALEYDMAEEIPF